MHSILQQVIFYIFAGLTILSALMVVTQKNPVHCVLYLVLAFFTSSVLWILLQAEFLALILVLVYVGAVMTLFLFVVMMLNIDREVLASPRVRYLPIGLIITALLVALLLKALPIGAFATEQAAGITNVFAALSNTESIGMVLYTDYLLAFELAAVILLVAIVASITLVHRITTLSKRQSSVKQIMTRKEDRVTLVQMKSEK